MPQGFIGALREGLIVMRLEGTSALLSRKILVGGAEVTYFGYFMQI